MVVRTPEVGLVATNGNETEEIISRRVLHLEEVDLGVYHKEHKYSVESSLFVSMQHSNIKDTLQFLQLPRSLLRPYQTLIRPCKTTK